jgi:hypothetical protein
LRTGLAQEDEAFGSSKGVQWQPSLNRLHAHR